MISYQKSILVLRKAHECLQWNRPTRITDIRMVYAVCC